jgi:hypothetical protein
LNNISAALKKLPNFGITSEAVYQWRNRPGRLIPKGRAAEAAYRTAGELEFNPERYGKNTSPNDQK